MTVMPKYNYVAMDSRGKETKGTLEVTSQNEAITRVKEMGLFPTKIVEVEKESQGKGGQKGQGQLPARRRARRRAESMQYQDQDSRAERPGKIKGVDDIHAPVGDVGGRRLAAVARLARAGKTGAKSDLQKHHWRAWRCRSKAAAHFPKVWRSTPRFLIGFSLTWSKPANWAVCWKLC